MQNAFDWLRRAQSGAEFLAIFGMLKKDPGCFERLGRNSEIGPVPTALTMPCARCGFYPRLGRSIYCTACRQVRDGTRNTGELVRETLVVWGFVNWLPLQLRNGAGAQDSRLIGAITPDDNHFLLMLRRIDIQPWLQDLVLYHGHELKGHIQLLPTIGLQENGLGMGDILCRAIHHETYFPMDRLRVRLYTRYHQVLRPGEYDKQGVLTYEVSDLMSLLDMARIFRSVLQPAEQEILFDLLTKYDETEGMFYWGRLLGVLNQQARDLLDAWDVRNWPEQRVKFFYELTKYVDYKPAR